MVAGQDAEAARIDRQRLVQAEFGREVRDRPRAEDAGMPAAPRVARAEILLHAPVGVVDAAVQRQLRRALLEMLDNMNGASAEERLARIRARLEREA